MGYESLWEPVEADKRSDAGICAGTGARIGTGTEFEGDPVGKTIRGGKRILRSWSVWKAICMNLSRKRRRLRWWYIVWLGGNIRWRVIIWWDIFDGTLYDGALRLTWLVVPEFRGRLLLAILFAALRKGTPIPLTGLFEWKTTGHSSIFFIFESIFKVEMRSWTFIALHRRSRKTSFIAWLLQGMISCWFSLKGSWFTYICSLP